MWKCVIGLIFLMVVTSNAEDEGKAQVVALKNILNSFVVKGKDITVQYELHNVGTKPALNVQLEENGFPKDYFEVKSGLLRARWSRLPAKSNVTHTVILTPLQSVVFNVSQAEIRYRAGEDARGYTVGHTSGSGEVVIFETEAYERQFSARATEWLTFALMSVPSIVIPLALWYKSHRKYVTLSNVRSKKD